MASTPPRSTRRAHALTALALAWGIAYLGWRVGWSLDGSPLWLSLPLLGAEVWAIIRLALFAAAAWRVPAGRRTMPDPTDPDRRSTPDMPGLPDIELLVPAAHTGVDELGRTLVVAAVDPPAAIRVLDVVYRPEVAEEARRHGADYQIVTGFGPVNGTHPGTDPAELIGPAIADSAFELVAWVNAGDVLAPGLATLAADLANPSVAVVQAATNYSNRDSLLHSAPERDERAVIERVIGPATGVHGACPWAGSGSVMRVSAIREVGGLRAEHGSATARASVRLQAKGWRIRFCEKPAVRVTAPDTLDDYLGLVAHDVEAGWSTLFTSDSPLIKRGLRLRSRLALIESATRPLDGLARFTFLAVLAVTMLTGRLPMTASVGALVLLWAPAWYLRSAALLALSRGTLQRGDLTRQSLRRMGVHLQVIGGRRSHADLPTTDAGARSASRTVRIAGRMPLVSAAAVVLNVGIILRALTFFFPTLLRPFSDSARIAVMAAAVYAIVPIVDVLQVLLTRQQRRANHRISTELIAEIGGVSCTAHDLTPRGLGVDLVDPPAIGDRVDIVLSVPRLTREIDSIGLTGVVKHVSAETTTGSKGSPARRRVGLQLVDVAPEARDALVEICALTASERDELRDATPQLSPDQLDLRTGSAWRKGLAALNVVGLLTAGLVVIAVPAGAESVPAEGTSIISGVVVDEQGAPLPEVCVASDTVGKQSPTTDGDGRFVLEQVPAGDHVVYAYDCQGRGGYARTFHPNAATPELSKVVHVDDGTKNDISIQMLPTGRVYGSVVDSDGTPIPAVCIGFAVEGTETVVPWAKTDDEGRYSLDVPAGRVALQFTDCTSPPRFAETWYPGVGDRASSKTVDVIAHDKVELGQLVMMEGSSISGRVTDGEGAPLENICVSLQDVADGSWTKLADTTTDGKGGYQFAVPAGSHSLLFADCSNERRLVDVWYGGIPSWMNPPPTIEIGPGPQGGFDQQLETGGFLAGTVTAPDGSVPEGVCIAIHPTKLLLDQADWTTAYWGPSDPKTGEWVTHPVPSGSYIIQYVNCDERGYQASGRWSEEYYAGVFPDDRNAELEQTKQIEVRAGDKPERIDHQLRAATRLTGVVTVKGAPVANVCVGATPDGTGTRTNDDGSWSLSVKPGDHELTFTDCEQGRGLVQTTVTATLDESGVSDPIDTRLRRRPVGTLAGTVATASGLVPESTCVVAYVPNDAPAFGQVQPDGSWEMTGLGAGRYWVAAINCDSPDSPMVDPKTGEGYGPTWYPANPANLEKGAQPDADGAKRVEVLGGETVGKLDLCLGDCSVKVDEPPTTEPPTTTTSTTTTTVAPTTVAPTTTAPRPTTTVAPTTTAPRPTTTVAPTTAAPRPTTTVAPTTVAPTTAAPRPTTTTNRTTTTDATSSGGGMASAASNGTTSVPPEPIVSQNGDVVETGTPPTTVAGPATSDDAATATNGITPVIDTSAGWNDATDVEGLSVRAPSRTSAGAPTELASRDVAAPGTSTTPLGAGSDRIWVVLAGLALFAVAGGCLVHARRRGVVAP